MNEEDRRRSKRNFLPDNPPNSIIMLRGLNYDTTETQIRQLVQSMGYKVESVRLVRDKQTGKSKGFGFLKFFELHESVAFMGRLMKEPLCIDGFYVQPDYSTSTMEDWKCEKCGGFNYERRINCYQCNNLRPEELEKTIEKEPEPLQINDGSFDISQYYSYFLLLRGLDIMSDEERIFQAVSQFSPRRIFLVRQEGRSLGFAFMEFSELTTVQLAYNRMANGIIIDKRKVTVTYGRDLYAPYVEGMGRSFYPVYWDTRTVLSEYPWNYNASYTQNEIYSQAKTYDNQEASNVNGFETQMTEFYSEIKTDHMKDINELLASQKALLEKASISSSEILYQPTTIGPVQVKTKEVRKEKKKQKGEMKSRNPLLDYSKLICFLCYRRFKDASSLKLHEKASKFHAANAEKLSEIENSKKVKMSMQDNVGSKLMAKMGWKEGEGLGKEKSGITNPITALMRPSGAGLGAEVAAIDPTLKYHERGKQIARSRYDSSNK